MVPTDLYSYDGLVICLLLRRIDERCDLLRRFDLLYPNPPDYRPEINNMSPVQ